MFTCYAYSSVQYSSLASFVMFQISIQYASFDIMIISWDYESIQRNNVKMTYKDDSLERPCKLSGCLWFLYLDIGKRCQYTVVIVNCLWRYICLSWYAVLLIVSVGRWWNDRFPSAKFCPGRDSCSSVVKGGSTRDTRCHQSDQNQQLQPEVSVCCVTSSRCGVHYAKWGPFLLSKCTDWALRHVCSAGAPPRVYASQVLSVLPFYHSICWQTVYRRSNRLRGAGTLPT